MTRQFAVIAVLLGVLAIACGKYGPPVRVRSDTAAAEGSKTTATSGTSAAEESDEKEKKP